MYGRGVGWVGTVTISRCIERHPPEIRRVKPRGFREGDSVFPDMVAFVITRRGLRSCSSTMLLLSWRRSNGIKGDCNFDSQANHYQRARFLYTPAPKRQVELNCDRETRQADGKRKHTGGRTMVKNGHRFLLSLVRLERRLVTVVQFLPLETSKRVRPPVFCSSLELI